MHLFLLYYVLLKPLLVPYDLLFKIVKIVIYTKRAPGGSRFIKVIAGCWFMVFLVGQIIFICLLVH